MNLDFSDDQKALKKQINAFLRRECSPERRRRFLEGPEAFDRELYKGLAELGALGLAIPEQFGGVGLTTLELCVLAEELGRVIAPVPVLSSIYLCAELILRSGSEDQKQFWLPRLANGSAVGVLASTEGSGISSAAAVDTKSSNGKLYGFKSPVLYGDIADFAIVLGRADVEQEGVDGNSLYLVDLNCPGVNRRGLSTIEATRTYACLEFEGAAGELLGRRGDADTLISEVSDRAAVLLAFEQLGGADQAIEMARDYALGRMAFGRPIGSFQAIKHMLADMYVSATLARSNCYYGAWALSSGVPELPMAAATARLSATQAFQHCAKNNIQIHGGMGFTWEFECHLYYRRSNALAVDLGPQHDWQERLIGYMRDHWAGLAQRKAEVTDGL